MPNIHLDNGVPWSPSSAPTVSTPVQAAPTSVVNPNAPNLTGTLGGTHNPHTDTGFSGGPHLVSGATNPGYSPPPPGGGNDGNGGGTGLPGGGDPDGGTDTGSESSGESGYSGSGYKGGMSAADLAALTNSITGSNILGGGVDNLRKTSRNTLSGIDSTFEEGWKNLEAKPVDTTINTDLLQPTIQDTINDYIGIDALGGEFGLNDQGWGFTSGSGNFQGGVNIGLDGKVTLGGNVAFADGGPVGLMSLPQGYAVGGGVDPSDWRVIQQIIAAGENPEDYGYKNGGEVVEESETMEESTPFGGTRENIMDHIEAFDNAPMHMEEPMVGMYGEKVPLSIARRVQGYMEGLDPVKRNMIQETMNMFRMKKMLEEQQDMQGSGSYFGEQPQEYSI
jgi:hypothetical protein|tara:strand:+ start:490 stop:1665 length:1176 start_codon:yes stop_codon:yes gene_type:complete